MVKAQICPRYLLGNNGLIIQSPSRRISISSHALPMVGLSAVRTSLAPSDRRIARQELSRAAIQTEMPHALALPGNATVVYIGRD